MAHLRAEELIDLVEGNGDQASVAHAASCEGCGRQVAELREILGAVQIAEIPEPSPLFWEHLSARVRDAVAAKTPARGLSWWWVIAAASMCAALLLAAVLTRTPRSKPASVPSIENAQSATGGVGTTSVPDAAANDDPSLDLIADLASGLDWDDAAAAGLTARATVVERAMNELTGSERAELERLLRQELSRSGA